MVSQIAFSLAIASASVIAAADGFSDTVLVFAISRFAGGAVQAAATINTEINTNNFFISGLLAFLLIERRGFYSKAMN
jgi:hypothetical protein